MSRIDLLIGIALFSLPLLLLCVALGRRRRSHTFGRSYSSPGQALVTHRTATATNVSFVTQVGLVAEIVVAAIGYVTARLRGGPGSTVETVRAGATTTYGLTVGDEYRLDVGVRRDAPEHYQGAEVEIVEDPEPIALEVVVEGAGVEIAGSERTLTVRANEGEQIEFRIDAATLGATTLRIELRQSGAWKQDLEIPLDIRPRAAPSEPRLAAAEPTPLSATTVETSLPVPASVPDPAPRDLALSLHFAPSEGRTYCARAHHGTSARTLDITLRESDLAELSEGLRDALEDVRRCFGDTVEIDDEGDESRHAVLDRLARRGYAAFNRIFSRPEDRAYVTSALAASSAANVEIRTDSFFLPWELLYEPYDAARLSYRNFWGFRYDIGRLVNGVRQTATAHIVANGPPQLALFSDPDLTHAVEQERPYFRDMGDRGTVALREWSAVELDASKANERHALRSAFFDFCRARPNHLAHFACHAVADARQSGRSYLRLSDELTVSVEDMTIEDFFWTGSPVVVLNACGTGVRDPRKTSDFVRRFMQSGARGVIATECDVPDAFAAAFVRPFYDRVLAGERFGRALLATRRHFLDRYRNPVGLLYAAYMSLDTRLARSETEPPGPDGG